MSRTLRGVKVVVFDFDGVLLDSADIKTDAFGRLFTGEDPGDASKILDYHKANAGMSRYEKFRWAYREILKRPLSEKEETVLGDRFNEMVEGRVAAAEWIAGAETFLLRNYSDTPLYVASGTPESELRRIVDNRDIGVYFKGIYGSPPKKKDILLRIAEEQGCSPAELVMVGDAPTDWKGAVSAKTRFIGVVPQGRPSPFPEGTTVLHDLTGLEGVLAS